MIDPRAIVTYAQYNEDIILSALLHDVKKGFYVDVGANHPTIDSVTKLFYDQGWHGINVEPLHMYYKQLVKARPKDTNLQIGLGDKAGKATLREYKNSPGHSTLDDHQKQQDNETDYVDYQVSVKTLSDILKRHKIEHIHFLKVDVEGFEYQVLDGNDWQKFRPEVVCIEANHQTRDWRPFFVQNNYTVFIADGLNEYYVAKESWQRTEGFAERVIELDYHALKQHQAQSWEDDSKTLLRLHEVAANQDTEIKRLQEEVRQLRTEIPQT